MAKAREAGGSGSTPPVLVGLVLDQTEACLGSALTGTVLLECRGKEQRVRRLRVSVTQGDARHDALNLISASVELNADFVIQPGERRREPFRLILPRHSDELWPVEVSARWDLPGHLWPFPSRTGQWLPLYPPRGFLAVAGLLIEPAAVRTEAWRLMGSGDGFAVRLTPVDWEKRLIDSLWLELFPSGDEFYGELKINPRENSRAEQLRALLVPNVQSFPIRGRFADLEEIRREFQAILAPFRRAATDAGRLPVPSTGPVNSAGALPLPVSVPDASELNRPRPAGGEGEPEPPLGRL